MRPALLLTLAGFAAASFACDAPALASPDVPPMPLVSTARAQKVPLIFVDGVRRSREALDRLSSSKIATIEVIKAAAAVRLYGDEGRAGVIHITTKP